jgi:hypothetical protein
VTLACQINTVTGDIGFLQAKRGGWNPEPLVGSAPSSLEGGLLQVSSAEQAAAIVEVVAAVREKDYWRAGVLIERFVREADLADLAALRTALTEEAATAQET